MVGSVLAGSGRRNGAFVFSRVVTLIWGMEIVCETGNHCTTPPLSFENRKDMGYYIFDGKF